MVVAGCLQVFDSLVDKNLSESHCLYGADFAIHEDEVLLPDGEVRCRELVISHKYEYESFHLVLEQEKQFDQVVEFLKEVSKDDTVDSLMKIDDSNHYSFGKLLVHIEGIPGL